MPSSIRKVGFHGAPNVSLLSLSLELFISSFSAPSLYVIQPHYALSSHSSFSFNPPFQNPRHQPSTGPSQNVPRKLKLSFYNLLHKIPFSSHHFQNLIIWHKSSPALLQKPFDYLWTPCKLLCSFVSSSLQLFLVWRCHLLFFFLFYNSTGILRSFYQW